MSTITEALKKAKSVDFLLELDFGGYKLRVAQRDLSIPYSGYASKRFEGVIKSGISFSSNFDMNSFAYSQRSLNVELINKKRFQDYEKKLQVDGGIGTLYLWCDGLDWSDIENDGIIFKGIFRKTYHNLDSYVFALYEQPYAKFYPLPRWTINETTFPNHRTEGGSGSTAGLPQAMIFGDWSKGIPLKCIDTIAYRYLAGVGPVKSTEAEYNAGTEKVYDKDGSVISAANYTFYPNSNDGLGRPVATFTFTSNQSANEPLSCSIRGIYDEIGTITPAAGDLLENLADIIHYLLSNRTNLDDDEIDVESIKTARSLLAPAKIATIVNQQVEGASLFSRILNQGSAAMLQRRGRIGLMVLDRNVSIVHRLKRSDQIGRTLGISKTPPDLIVNNLLVRYGLNPTTGEWEGEFVLDRTNDARCAHSYYTYGAQPQQTLELPDIQNKSSAEFLASKRLDIFAERHDIIEREVPYWVDFDMAEGDAVEIEAIEGASLDGQGWSAEKCILLDRTYNERSVTQRLWRVNT